MDKVAGLGKAARADLFRETAARMSLSPVIVEKDFWVCWLLKRLFTAKEFEGWLVFKGGTSLSKCFNLIPRFSEDLDIAVDFEKLGFTGGRDPRQAGLSHKKRAPLLADMQEACRRYVAGPFLNALTGHVRDFLGPAGWSARTSSTDANTVEFAYPSALEDRLDYVRPIVVLELGTHAEPVPHDTYPIRPFAAERFPQAFADPACPVTAVVARRTFWEKAAILHAEYHRPADKTLPARYSRHYADVAMMAQARVADEALADLPLLRSVIIHKDRFYHCAWAKYRDALPGSFRLLPREERLPALRQDYRAMAPMFLGEPPAFDAVLDYLDRLEKKLNTQVPST